MYVYVTLQLHWHYLFVQSQEWNNNIDMRERWDEINESNVAAQI